MLNSEQNVWPRFNPDRWFINPLPFNREYNTDPRLKALKRKGLINHGSTLGFRGSGGLAQNSVLFGLKASYPTFGDCKQGYAERFAGINNCVPGDYVGYT